MLPAKTEESHLTMEAVQELFDRWREKRKHRDPIPPALWGPLTSTIELTKPTGERMTITGGCNVAELVRVFLG